MVLEYLKMQQKNTLKLGGVSQKLTNTEAAVLHYLTQDFLTVKQIAIRRKCSIQNIYEIKKKLEKKGMLSRAYKTLEKNRCTLKVSAIRFHGLEFNIRIIYKDHRYKNLIGKIIYIDGETIRCYRDSIEVYGNQSFDGEDEQRATAKAMGYYQRLFYQIENDLKINIIKYRKQNIELVKGHYAEINNEMARECEITGDKIKIYAREDGKLWFMVDNSFNLFEAETQHRHTNKRDMGIVRKHLNDWRDNNPPTLSELNTMLVKVVDIMHEQAEANKQTAYGLKSIMDLIKPQQEMKGLAPMKKADYIL